MDDEERTEDLKLSYLGTLGVVSALIIQIVTENDLLSYYTVPNAPIIFLRIFHSISFWSLYAAILSSISGLFTAIKFKEQKFMINTTTWYFMIGISSFVVFHCVSVVVRSFRILRSVSDVRQLPPSLRGPVYLAYTVPQLLILGSYLLNLALMIAPFYSYNKEAALNGRMTQATLDD